MFALPELPYPYDALSPFVSADTLRTHHDKHHKTYVDKTNDLAAKAGLTGRALEDVAREAHRLGDKKLFNNAAQAWNHAFFWACMRPPGGEAPSGDLVRAINEAFDDLGALKAAFVDEGANHFASGWVWIVTGSEGLKVISTHDADDTLVHDGVFPLLVCDLWEHAYYVDYRNDRKGFLDAWFDALPNWRFAAAQLAAARAGEEGWKHPGPDADEASAAA
jgi:Fe-Mn family superoxide dismutase